MFLLFRVSSYSLRLLLVLASLSCAPVRTSISESDLERLVERMAERKVQIGLNRLEGQSMPKDWVLFQEACEVYRLDPDSALVALEKRSRQLAKRIRDSK